MAVTANIHEAKTTLSRLIERAMAGEEVIIAKAGKPLVHLTPIPQALQRTGPIDHSTWMGSLRGQIHMPDDFEFTDAEIGEMFYGERAAAPNRGVAEPDPDER